MAVARVLCRKRHWWDQRAVIEGRPVALDSGVYGAGVVAEVDVPEAVEVVVPGVHAAPNCC